ncbi:NADH-quinone oxidoreductase subunit L [Tahibacter amnicola]|uniref:NADH-quinone oxidoreductase subunit L n=1 Tax=Tahibacter amnicola TaxID=2976241 RepID=A0ABY6BI99_9GAMM|nr:NADH-quinone oxidoreductase subunit L [Tahibacter amnicola]UXI69738.1 NADH-quinone oxidoreductase subunit L [Tahibacter amnicola]
MITPKLLLVVVALAPLFGAIVAGLFGRTVGRAGAHTVTIAGVAVSFLLSCYVLYQLSTGGWGVFNENLYTWFEVGPLSVSVGFLVDRLTAVMMVVVTSVSLLVHLYTIGYMHEDPGYQRFFSYISLFTFSMLMLVMSNNFMQLFFGWEAVGLVSYLLIGFWFKRPTAIFANMKAFLVNRVGDFGFLLGIAAVLLWFGSLDYQQVFAEATKDGALAGKTLELIKGHPWSAATVIGVLLFVGAMGKSAQVPLHVWLPDSMEGPTPISALIHAATMVTAGIFMVARMSPLYELSETALSFIMIVGATTALFTGLIGIVQNDVKRVVAYSTLSQLGYMTVALGASAYSAAIFHLMTHAFFKALLFLGAGSVIIAMHHEQDMRYMGGLRKYMPVTFATAWIGTLALTGFPGFSGFFSKDAIIEAVGHSHRFGSGYAYACVLIGVFVTALYSFRLIYLTYHGKERFEDKHEADYVVPEADTPEHEAQLAHDHAHHDHGHHAPHESPWVVTVPLVLLAIPSIFIGWLAVEPMLFGDFFAGAIHVHAGHNPLEELKHEFHGPRAMVLHGLTQWPFLLALAGFATATYVYLFNPSVAAKAAKVFAPLYRILQNKYGIDDLYFAVFARGGVKLGRGLWRGGDVAVIDNGMVNGSAALVARVAATVRRVQSGYLYHYAFAMILGLIVLLGGLWLAAR